MPDPDLITRWVCVALAALALIMLAVRWRAWTELPRRLFFYGIALAVLVFSVGYGVVEGIAMGTAGGSRFVLVLTSLLLVALASVIPDRNDSRRNR